MHVTVSEKLDVDNYAMAVVIVKNEALMHEIVVHLNDTKFTTSQTGYMLLTFKEPKVRTKSYWLSGKCKFMRQVIYYM